MREIKFRAWHHTSGVRYFTLNQTARRYRGSVMGIEYYGGIPGVAIEVKSTKELHEALDILHTQVMDNISEEAPELRILEAAMEKIEDENPHINFF